jgi:hypothetical protein
VKLCPNTGKVCHATPAEAARHLRVMKRKGQRGLEVYRCGSCHEFHIGREHRRMLP